MQVQMICDVLSLAIFGINTITFFSAARGFTLRLILFSTTTIPTALALISALTWKMAPFGKKMFTGATVHGDVPLILEMTIDDIATSLDAGKFTSVQLVETFLERIKEVDHIFHSIIETNPDAVHIARELDEERMFSQKRRRYAHL